MPQKHFLSFTFKLLIIGVFGFFLIVWWLERDSYAVEKKTERMSLFEVPTSGKIMDVEFRPEFDEWWVKCREGENIAVYTYDRRNNKWGRVQFVPKKADIRAQPAQQEQPATPQNAPIAPKTPEQAKPVETKPEPAKQPEPKKPESKWWDPLNVLKGGEKLMRSLEGR